jgi:2-keto-4-pentenoate hydratase/2-oxohepta-3-ene-1,7-dioic acid hydratase in catechol pathway
VRLARVRQAGAERPVVLDSAGGAYELDRITADVDGAFLAGGGVARVRLALSRGDLPPATVAGRRLGAPVARPGKIVCIGLNYAHHAAETGAEPPAEPVVFLKAPDTVVGPDDEVLVPRGSTKTDYEVELGVVLGATARYLDSPADAAAVIAGYAISNDVSERAFQHERGGQWDKGKSCETLQRQRIGQA